MFNSHVLFSLCSTGVLAFLQSCRYIPNDRRAAVMSIYRVLVYAAVLVILIKVRYLMMEERAYHHEHNLTQSFRNL